MEKIQGKQYKVIKSVGYETKWTNNVKVKQKNSDHINFHKYWKKIFDLFTFDSGNQNKLKKEEESYQKIVKE